MEKYIEKAWEVIDDNRKLNFLFSASENKNCDVENLTLSLVKCCEATALARKYYDEIGYPNMLLCNELKIKGEPSNILLFDEDIKKMWESTTGLIVKNSFTWGRNDFFRQNQYAENMYSYLMSCIKEGTYELVEDDFINGIKRDVIVNSMKIAYEIFKGQQVNPEYSYEDMDGFTKLKKGYRVYTGSQTENDISKKFVGDLLYDINENYKYKVVDHNILPEDIEVSFNKMKMKSF